jgi:ATP-dependent DNA helicase RecG
MFFWVGLVEEVGTGTNKIVNWCKEWGLPEADFEYVGNSIVLRFRKDIYTEEYLRNIGLNERQIKGVSYVKEKEKITNREYRELLEVTDRTALRDLNDLCAKGIFQRVGKTGRTTEYVLSRHKPDKPDMITT